MCTTSNSHRHSIFCILPPHILVEIAKNGSPSQRAFAIDTLAVDNSIRSFRAAAAPNLAQRQLVQTMPGTTSMLKRTIFDAQRELRLA